MNISAGLAGFAAIVGFAAALYALKASRVGIQPGWSFEPGDVQLSQMGWTSGIMEAFGKSGDLNRKAAFLTLIGGALSSASFVAGILGW
jgi:hypothetical protein